MIQATFFYLVALAVISTAWYAVSSSKLLNAALSLALSFFAIGGLFFMLGVPFLGMLQILMCRNLIDDEPVTIDQRHRSVVATGFNG